MSTAGRAWLYSEAAYSAQCGTNLEDWTCSACLRLPQSMRLRPKVQVGRSPSTDVFAFAGIADDGSLVIAFRGTSSLRNIWTDARFFQEKWNEEEMVHTGFGVAAKELIGDFLFRAVDQHAAHDPNISQVIITGHSLGAAVAHIYLANLLLMAESGRLNGTHFILRPEVQVGLYTFGQPRAGNLPFASAFWRRAEAAAVRAFRVVNGPDPVTQVPCKFMGYRHTSVAVHFAASGQMQIYPRGREVECFEGWDGFSWHSSDSYRSVLVQFDSCSSIRPACSLPDFTKESFFNGSVSTSDLESESFWRDLYDANLSDIAEEDLYMSLENVSANLSLGDLGDPADVLNWSGSLGPVPLSPCELGASEEHWTSAWAVPYSADAEILPELPKFKILVPVGVSALRATCGGPGGRGARGRAYREGDYNGAAGASGTVVEANFSLGSDAWGRTLVAVLGLHLDPSRATDLSPAPSTALYLEEVSEQALLVEAGGGGLQDVIGPGRARGSGPVQLLQSQTFAGRPGQPRSPLMGGANSWANTPNGGAPPWPAEALEILKQRFPEIDPKKLFGQTRLEQWPPQLGGGGPGGSHNQGGIYGLYSGAPGACVLQFNKTVLI
ncbi:unnamed protein product [Effrenium voratum]|nr:unnamed protein product [Effrenium voratum]